MKLNLKCRHHRATPVVLFRTATTVLPCRTSVTTKEGEGGVVVAVEIIWKIFFGCINFSAEEKGEKNHSQLKPGEADTVFAFHPARRLKD